MVTVNTETKEREGVKTVVSERKFVRCGLVVALDSRGHPVRYGAPPSAVARLSQTVMEVAVAEDAEAWPRR